MRRERKTGGREREIHYTIHIYGTVDTRIVFLSTFLAQCTLSGLNSTFVICIRGKPPPKLKIKCQEVQASAQ